MCFSACEEGEKQESKGNVEGLAEGMEENEKWTLDVEANCLPIADLPSLAVKFKSQKKRLV